MATKLINVVPSDNVQRHIQLNCKWKINCPFLIIAYNHVSIALSALTYLLVFFKFMKLMEITDILSVNVCRLDKEPLCFLFLYATR